MGPYGWLFRPVDAAHDHTLQPRCQRDVSAGRTSGSGRGGALRQAGADVIIALTHLTIDEDRQLARQVPGISLILGGHEHDPITWYEDNTLIHKSGYDAHYLGCIDLVMDKTTTEKGPRVTVTPSWRMLANHGITPDPEVAARVAEYTAKLDSELAQPLGEQTALDSQRGEVRTRETTMGNLVADALREAMAEAVLINGGGIRGDRLYEPGTVLTRRDILPESCPLAMLACY